MIMNKSIEVVELYKKYGDNIVLDGISMSLVYGNTYGIIGRNGSGKTVLLKCISGLTLPTKGEVVINGQTLGKDIDVPKSMGIIIETPFFLPNYSGKKNLRMLAKIRSVIYDSDIETSMKKVGLDPSSKKHVRKYSLGMRQRLGIAQAIMEKPEILILDEPLNGIDKQGIADMRMLLRDYRSDNHIIILASHNSEGIKTLCDVIYEIEDGQIINTYSL